LYRRPQYLHVSPTLPSRRSNWIYSTGCPLAPPPGTRSTGGVGGGRGRSREQGAGSRAGGRRRGGGSRTLHN
jgi:hypothetical protein